MSIKGYKYMIESLQDTLENGKKKEKEPKDNANWTNNSFHLLSLLFPCKNFLIYEKENWENASVSWISFTQWRNGNCALSPVYEFQKATAVCFLGFIFAETPETSKAQPAAGFHVNAWCLSRCRQQDSSLSIVLNWICFQDGPDYKTNNCVIRTLLKFISKVSAASNDCISF